MRRAWSPVLASHIVIAMPGNAEEATLVISRKRGGWRDRARRYDILVDGKPMGKIKHGERLELLVPPGQHELFLKIAWCTSPSITFTAQPGDVVEFFCEPGAMAVDALQDVLGNTSQYIRLTLVAAHTP